MDDLPFDFYERTIRLISGHVCLDCEQDLYELQWLKVFPHLSHLSDHWKANYVWGYFYVCRDSDMSAPVPRFRVGSSFNATSNGISVTVQSFAEACQYSTNLKNLKLTISAGVIVTPEQLNWRELDANEMRSLGAISKKFVNVDFTCIGIGDPEFLPKLTELGFVCNYTLDFTTGQWTPQRDEFIISQVRLGALRHLLISGELLACRERTAFIFRTFFESSVFHQIELYDDNMKLLHSQFRDVLTLWARCTVPKAIRKSLRVAEGSLLPNGFGTGSKSRRVSYHLENGLERFGTDRYIEERPSRVARFWHTVDYCMIVDIEFIDLGD